MKVIRIPLDTHRQRSVAILVLLGTAFGLMLLGLWLVGWIAS